MDQKPPRIFNLDLSDEALAAQFAVPQAVIIKVRKLLARAPTPSERFAGVDWHKTNGQIAAELKVGYAVVRHARAKYGHPCRRIGRKGWAHRVDWSKTNAQIAEETGISLKSVAVIRSTRKRLSLRPASETTGFKEHAGSAGNIDWRLRDIDIAVIYGVSSHEVAFVRRKCKAELPLFVDRKPTAECVRAKAAQKVIADGWYASKATSDGSC